MLRILSLSFTVMVFGHLSLLVLSAHALLGRLAGITLVGALARIALLAILIPPFGLTGAALAAAGAVLLEQALTVATAMRRFGIPAGALIGTIWRPVLATAVMAGVLWTIGLGWSQDAGVPVLIKGSLAGAAVYAAMLVGSWRLAGRPAGAEADVLSLLLNGLSGKRSRPR